MIDIKQTLQVILQDSGCRTWPIHTPAYALSAVCFEDEALLGFAYVFKDVAGLLTHWQTVETGLLNRYAERLREAGEKAWNVYSIFLCAASATGSQLRELHWIEENLERTRKIAACNLAGRDDLVSALLPVLPIQYQPSLNPEDLTERLRKRIATISPAATDAALDENFNPAEVVPLLTASK